MTFQQFADQILKPLQGPAEAFHGQLFPRTYPPDFEIHHWLKSEIDLPDDVQTALNDARAFRSDLRHNGIQLPRLRTLPTHYDDDIPADIKMCQTFADDTTGETVRVCRFEDQLARLATSNVANVYHYALRQPVPRAGIWTVSSLEDNHRQLKIAGTMDYTDDGQPKGIDMYDDIPTELQDYVAFWHEVYDSDEYSLPLKEWGKLYE